VSEPINRELLVRALHAVVDEDGYIDFDKHYADRDEIERGLADGIADEYDRLAAIEDDEANAQRLTARNYC
jgi:hypothetical protein